jgi:hypothetical protein
VRYFMGGLVVKWAGALSCHGSFYRNRCVAGTVFLSPRFALHFLLKVATRVCQQAQTLGDYVCRHRRGHY